MFRNIWLNNILVNAIAPGFIETDMTSVLKDDVKTNILNSIPLKREGKPEEVANVVKFLASDDSSYVTGQIISNVTTTQVGDVATFLLSGMSSCVTGQIIYADNGFSIMGV